jgi:hypothetical protein
MRLKQRAAAQASIMAMFPFMCGYPFLNALTCGAGVTSREWLDHVP